MKQESFFFLKKDKTRKLSDLLENKKGLPETQGHNGSGPVSILHIFQPSLVRLHAANGNPWSLLGGP